MLLYAHFGALWCGSLLLLNFHRRLSSALPKGAMWGMAALLAAPCLAASPQWTSLAPEETNYCGDPSLDIYFNKHCGHAVTKVAQNCCDDFPPSEECDEWRMSCINQHIKEGKCSDVDDCESGCRMFNSLSATCCPHVRQRSASDAAMDKLVLKAVPPQEDEPPAQHPALPQNWGKDASNQWCNSQANDDFFANVCGWDNKAGHEVASECCDVQHLKRSAMEKLQASRIATPRLLVSFTEHSPSVLGPILLPMPPSCPCTCDTSNLHSPHNPRLRFADAEE